MARPILISNFHKVFLTIIFLIGFFAGNAQYPVYTPNSEITFKVNNRTLKNPIIRGMGSPQFNSMELNGDGLSDLIVFDKVGDKVLTFLNVGSTNYGAYEYAPEYESWFPKVQNFVHLVDYNCDGIKDIFTSKSLAPPNALLTIYEGSKKADQSLFFTEVLYQVLDTTGLIVNHVFDIPAITDINGDGDVDVLHFPQSASHISYYENQSVEMGFDCEELIFELEDKCWGKVGYTSGDTLQLDNCPNFTQSQGESGGCLGAFLLAKDLNADGSKDLIYSSLFTNSLSQLFNNGTSSQAFFNNQNPGFLLDEVAEFPDFPAASSVDLNNDGVEDLTVISNRFVGTLSGSGVEKVFHFQNYGTNENPFYQLNSESFLLDETIDHGFRSAIATFDYNLDGLTDILIAGNYAHPTLTYISRVAFYENTGTPTHPEFTLADDNFLDLSSANLKALHPTLGDLDMDGDVDLLLGDFKGRLLYFENIADPVALPEFQYVDTAFQWLDVGNYSRPQIVDANRDGWNDILIGSASGRISFLKNIGAPGYPEFDLVTQSLGNIFMDTFNVESSPVLLESEGDKWQLLVAAKSGKIKAYEPDFEDFDEFFEPIDAGIEKMDVGSGATIHAADLNNDDVPELLVGNERGGINIFELSDQPLTQIFEPKLSESLPGIYPNPAQEFLFIDFPTQVKTSVNIEIFELTGKLRLSKSVPPFVTKYQLKTSCLSTGIHVCKLSNGERTITRKIVIAD